MKRFARVALAAMLVSSSLPAHAADVLVVLSDENHLDLKDGKVFSTGFYLNELMQPTKMLLDAGHSVTFATPHGKAPTLDQSSDDPQYFGNDESSFIKHKRLLEQLKLTSPEESPVISLARVEQIGYDRFDALYVPGGHAPMQDLLKNPELGKLLTAFHNKGKTTALVCHGPIALLSTLPEPERYVQQLEQGGTAVSDQSWIYSGYRMTVISNEEEEQAKPSLGGGEMKFYPQTALEGAGAEFVSNTQPWSANVVMDRELITGQNPASAADVGHALVERLK